MRHIVNKAVRHGVQLYRTMRHHASVWDGRVQAAARIYTAVSPVLRMHGEEARQLDRTLKAGYDHYESYARNVRDGIQVLDGIAAHTRGGYSYT